MLTFLRALPRRFRLALLLALPASGAAVAAVLLSYAPARTAVVGLVGAGATVLVALLILPLAHALLAWVPPAHPRWEEDAAEAPGGDSGGGGGGPRGAAAVRHGVGGRGGGASGTDRGRGSLDLLLEQHASRVDDTELRIGLVLSGGGAKGVYQAGALAAVREFLEREGALPYVRTVAATSVGTWNAMFWLTGRIADGTLRSWWTSRAATDIVSPAPYVPYLRNYLLRNGPWRRQFDRLFGHRADDIAAAGPPWIYFTRTNVDRAALEAATNRGPEARYWQRASDGEGYEPAGRIVDEEVGRYALRSGRELRTAVFTSMDIPPLFPRHHEDDHAFEDGGVLDNLPIRYATRLEGCNLLFVLPLNASFRTEHSDRSIVRRLTRVMTVRQGALERTALRDISLYNRLIEAGGPEPGFTGAGDCLGELHLKPVTTFCVAPGPSMEIGTFGFPEVPDGGGRAFDRMFRATREELERFDFSPGNRDVRMRVVPADPVEPMGERDFTLR